MSKKRSYAEVLEANAADRRLKRSRAEVPDEEWLEDLLATPTHQWRQPKQREVFSVTSDENRGARGYFCLPGWVTMNGQRVAVHLQHASGMLFASEKLGAHCTSSFLVADPRAEGERDAEHDPNDAYRPRHLGFACQTHAFKHLKWPHGTNNKLDNRARRFKLNAFVQVCFNICCFSSTSILD